MRPPHFWASAIASLAGLWLASACDHDSGVGPATGPAATAALDCTFTAGTEGRCGGPLASPGGGSAPLKVVVREGDRPGRARVGSRPALRTRHGRGDHGLIEAEALERATFERGLTVAVLARLDRMPEGRAALLSQWATAPGGRGFELGTEWDGYAYFMVSRSGESAGMGIVHAEQPLERSGEVLLAASFEPGERLAVYANGALLAENTAVVPAALHRPATPTAVGTRPGCGRACTFDGAVGDVLVWDRALGNDEQAALAESYGMTGPAVRDYEDPEPEVIDIDPLVESLRDWYGELDTGGWPGAYRWQPRDLEPQLYASADIAWIRWIIGDLDRLSEEDRARWVAYLQSFQDPRDGSYPPQRLHDRGHALAHVTVALNALGGAHRYQPRFLDPLLEPGAVEPWLEGLDWYWQWGGSCTLWGHGMVLLSSLSTPPWWEGSLFDWLDREVDPELGAWRRGYPVRHQVDYFGGGFHIWTLYSTAGRPLPYPDRIIDLVLALQRADGDFDRKFGCGVLDGVWALAEATDQTSYRSGDVEVALRRSLHALWELHEEGRFTTGSHGTLSRVGTLAILQRALPDEVVSTRPLCDPWTEPSLYEIRVERAP